MGAEGIGGAGYEKVLKGEDGSNVFELDPESLKQIETQERDHEIISGILRELDRSDLAPELKDFFQGMLEKHGVESITLEDSTPEQEPTLH